MKIPQLRSPKYDLKYLKNVTAYGIYSKGGPYHSFLSYISLSFHLYSLGYTDMHRNVCAPMDLICYTQ